MSFKTLCLFVGFISLFTGIYFVSDLLHTAMNDPLSLDMLKTLSLKIVLIFGCFLAGCYLLDRV